MSTEKSDDKQNKRFREEVADLYSQLSTWQNLQVHVL